MDLSQNTDESTDSQPPVAWGPLNRLERRIVGVLVEKSKTTPDVYPMTANSICNGANQKSNRLPKMALENETVEDALRKLRLRGAVIEVISDARVPKFKHALYPWLGVEKKELAVMTELLLRGPQTLGDLRTRASRMDSIANQSELKEIVASLIEKNLVLELTPPGRGQMVTHNLYHEQELGKIRADSGNHAAESTAASPESKAATIRHAASNHQLDELVQRIVNLEEQLELLKMEIEQIKS